MNGGMVLKLYYTQKNEFSQGSLGRLNFVNRYLNSENDEINHRVTSTLSDSFIQIFLKFLK